MLHPDRRQRPLATDLDTFWSDMSSSDDFIACKCAEVEVATNSSRLIKACQNGSTGEVEGLLNEGIDPNTMEAIHHNAEHRLLAIVQVLLGAGAYVDTRNPIKQTALQCAARNGSDDVVQFLLENHADVDAIDENHPTALQGAAGQGYRSIVKLLLDHNAIVYAEDLDCNTAMYFAGKRHHFVIQDLLRQHSKG